MDQNKFFLPIAVIAAGLLIAGAVVWNGSRPAPSDDGSVAVDVSKIPTKDDPYIGEADAPVTLILWSDFQCVYCRSFEVGGVPQITTPAAMPDIITQYVATGKVKVVFKDFAFLGQDSITGARYGRAVWNLYPEQYYAWREAMFNAQDASGDQGFGDEASIKELSAKIPGIDVAALAANVAANQRSYDALIEADRREGGKVGVKATPSVAVGTQVISGAYPFEHFQEAIEAAL